jgi:hypothetical protein
MQVVHFSACTTIQTQFFLTFATGYESCLIEDTRVGCLAVELSGALFTQECWITFLSVQNPHVLNISYLLTCFNW